MTQQAPSSLEIALDIGHSSIGWAVFRNAGSFDLLGTGVVLFPADDCLAVKRRAYRRQRRHVRATRQRIERLKRLLLHLGVLTEAELNEHPGQCAWPWKLAAEVLGGSGRILTWPELWDVLRWYAHNRGYDNNARWNKQENTEDTEKVENANSLMRQHGTKTMAATFCAVLEVEPGGAKRSSRVRFKGQNAAFPRETVQDEVRRILEAHIGKLSQVTPQLVRALVGKDGEWDDHAWNADIQVPAVKLPKRYKGSYLFGQSVPRFDNRIISSCPVTYARVLAATGDRTRALRDSKVPAKKCREFLLFRWAMILANLTVNDGHGTRRLTPEERKAIHRVMTQGDPSLKSVPGHLTPKQLKNAVIQKTGVLLNNVDTYFLTPRADEALWLRPERPPSGRAPHTRQLMKEATTEIFAGKHPAEEGGCLFRSEAVREAQLQRSLEEKTNNHLVRHRVLIARRLVADVIKSYAEGEKSRIGKVTIEVNRDLQAFSGMTNKQIEGELTQMLKDHSGVVKKLEKDFAEAGKKYRITPGLIRKARIANDLGWKCPYTGKNFDAIDLAEGGYDKEHIVPRSIRPSDSLESLVITSTQVNAMKKNRTALQFIKECGGSPVDAAPNLTLFPEGRFREFVDGLNTKGCFSPIPGRKRKYDPDAERKRKRKALLLLEKYEDKGFLPKDLTQTSHVVSMAVDEIEKVFKGTDNKKRVVHLPGSVTGAVRIGWQLHRCLAAHNPSVRKLLEREKTESLNIKQELRGLTHLHHALDACVIGCASHLLPRDGAFWRALLNRKARLPDLDEGIRQQIADRLGECRVVQHIPKRMDGLAAEETIWRVVDFDDSHPSSKRLQRQMRYKGLEPLSAKDDAVYIVHFVRKEMGGKAPKKLLHETEKFWTAYDKVAKDKLIGLDPAPGNPSPKLKPLKAVKIIDDNFGLALCQKDNNQEGKLEPHIIVRRNVWRHLENLKEDNDRRLPHVLRKGQLIKATILQFEGRGRPKKGAIPKEYPGIWRIASIKAASGGDVELDLTTPDGFDFAFTGRSIKREIRNLVPLRPSLIGTAVCAITS